MTGGTLILTRAVKLHNYYKKHLEGIGFKNIFITDVDKDGLNMIIHERKPALVMIEACFYMRSTPYMMFELLENFPELNIAVINIYDFPDEQAKWFVLNGVNSYVNMFEGIDEFIRGLEYIRDGNYYVSPNVEKCINKMSELPKPTSRITSREIEVLELFCIGKKENDIAKILHISRNTVGTHRRNLYRIFNVENRVQLFWAAVTSGKIIIDENFISQKIYLEGMNDC